MKFTAPAKINLALKITGKNDDGYHLLDSAIVFTEWGDEITITQSDEFRLTAEGAYSNIFTASLLSTDRGAPNLIVRAVYALINNRTIVPQVHVHVNKVIPSGAGLGGGSADAASVMCALNDYWEMDLSIDELCAIGLTIGAELPVCIRGHSARVTGIGDKVDATDIAQHTLLIVWPDQPLMTKDVFAKYDPSHNEIWDNDLTPAAISLCPEIEDIITQLRLSNGCQSASMTGSGSACFGIFETMDLAKAASKNFKNCVTTRTQV